MFIPRYQKTYLSRAMTRAMSIDHPIGDPHGGPAYGERNEPVSAIIAVVGMAATAEAAFAGSVMAGLAFAGSAISLVGNLTGNSTLSKIGAVAGLVGGAGAAGLFGEAAQSATFGSMFGGGSSAGVAAAAPTTELAQTPTAAVPDVSTRGVDAGRINVSSIPTDVGGSVNTSVQGPGLINSAAPSLASEPTIGAAVNPAAAAPDFSASTVGSAAPGAQTPVGAPAAPSASAIAAPSTPSTGFQAIENTAQAGQPGYGWQYFNDPAGGPGAAISPEGKYFLGNTQLTGANGGAMGVGDYANQAFQTVKGLGSSAMDLAKSNPGAAYVMGQAASGVGDYLSGKTTAQINQMEASGELSKAQADKIRYDIALNERRRQQLNTNMALPGGLQISPNSVINPGLISGARVGG